MEKYFSIDSLSDQPIQILLKSDDALKNYFDGSWSICPLNRPSDPLNNFSDFKEQELIFLYRTRNKFLLPHSVYIPTCMETKWGALYTSKCWHILYVKI